MHRPLDTVLAYHQRTKHHFHRYAAGPGGLDWATQPDPFRRFAGSPRLELPLLARAPSPLYADLYAPGRIAPQPLNLSGIAALLELSFGISAWKQYQTSRWALRCNPSSGNLHPTEAYVVVTGCDGVADGVHHYVSRDHLLEQRCAFAAPGPGGPARACAAFLVGLTSIHWREAWKYGERAYRYCQHDAGHAIAAVGYAAAALGWRARVLDTWGDTQIAAILGTDRDGDFGSAEREHPDLVLVVSTGPEGGGAPGRDSDPSPDALLACARDGRWLGKANPLSGGHAHDWPVIDEVATACTKPPTGKAAWKAPILPESLKSPYRGEAARIIRQRRSAQAFDGATSITAATFYRMLDMTLPRAGIAPFDAFTRPTRTHLLLFVHRVDGLAPGLYLFLRRAQAAETVRGALSADFEWAPVASCPDHFALYRLAEGDARAAARTLSCHQDIAADGAFSLGMLAEYDAALAGGAWQYRYLFWEAGMVGQVLYLEAEAAGVQGTGIGCYFDDAVHELAGIEGRTLQSMYHFTVGGALTDNRLQTLPPYAHLARAGS